MPRLGDVSSIVLALALLAFGIVADRALVAQAAAVHEKAAAAAGETARLTAGSVRAALGALEELVLAGRGAAPGVEVERVAAPPEPSVAPPSWRPYGRRPRSELTTLLQSTAVTPNGLPEAVLARLALGTAGVVSSSGEPGPDVAERLLSGELPVRIDDLSYLARALGVTEAARVRGLEARLRQAPEAASLPSAPAFRRELTPRQTVESWCLKGDLRIRYEIGLTALLKQAGVEGRARPVAAGDEEGAVAVPGVAGLALAVSREGAGALRVHALRWALWAAVATSLFGLLAVRRALRREARATSREKAFVAGVTHELRTPLAAIRLLAETLADGRGHPRDYGTLVAQETERLEGLVERVLSVARIDEAPHFAEVKPAEIVRSTVALLAPRAERRAVTLETAADELPLATWDEEAVRQALVNLVENAIRHGREGGHVMVRAAADRSIVRLSVHDDGPGISRHDRRSVFDRFVRGRTAGPGTGLGLYLVEQVARAHGGRVDLETEEGRGSTFTLVLPVVPPTAQGMPS